MHQFFRSPFFDFEALRILSTSVYGGAEVGEFLEAVGQIRDNDAESWHNAWLQQAQKAEEIANEAVRSGHRRAARGAFLRAANYTRASAYMLLGERLGGSGSEAEDCRTIPLLHKVVELFQRATDFFDGPVHRLSIPYVDSSRDPKVALSLPAYLYLPPTTCRLPGKAPLLINALGADSMQEEMYHMFPAEGPALGYAVLTFEGPGQGLTLHEHNVPMRPDWEAVSGAVLDYVEEYVRGHEAEVLVDLERIAVAGASLGGYFALRSAADARVKACVAIDPPYDFYDFGTEHVAPAFFGLWNKGWVPDGVVNAFISLGTWTKFQTKWEMFATSRFLGASSAVDMLRTMQKYTLKRQPAAAGTADGTGRGGVDDGGSYLSLIKCPALVTGAARSLYFDVASNTTVIFKGLASEDKELWIGETAAQGGMQAKMGALMLCNQRSFAFLDRVFGVSR